MPFRINVYVIPKRVPMEHMYFTWYRWFYYSMSMSDQSVPLHAAWLPLLWNIHLHYLKSNALGGWRGARVNGDCISILIAPLSLCPRSDGEISVCGDIDKLYCSPSLPPCLPSSFSFLHWQAAKMRLSDSSADASLMLVNAAGPQTLAFHRVGTAGTLQGGWGR